MPETIHGSMTQKELLLRPKVFIENEDDVEFVPVSGSEEHLIITIHGIRTMGQWMDDFTNSNSLNGIIKVSRVYINWVDVFTFLFGSHEQIISNAKREIQYLIETSRDKKISFICHSFGTKVLCEALVDIDYKFHHVYFIGGVAKKSDIHKIIKKIGCFVNDCGQRDYWPWIASFIAPKKYEAIGYYGTEPYGINRDFNSNHSQYASAAHINSNIVKSIVSDDLGVYRSKYRFERKYPTSMLNNNVKFGISVAVISILVFFSLIIKSAFNIIS